MKLLGRRHDQSAPSTPSASSCETANNRLAWKYVGRLAVDAVLRVGVATAVVVFASSAFAQWQAAPARVTVLLVAVVEMITAAIIVFSRCPQRRDWRFMSVLCSLYAWFYFLALDLSPGIALLPHSAGAAMQIVAITFQLYAKVSLGRSFGILPATRRLVTHGAYRLVRHPIYAGYLVSHVAFLLSNFVPWNVLVFAVLYAVQVVRMQREEEVLMALAGYRDYCREVRYRLIPGLY